jgi:hypothetical protein
MPASTLCPGSRRRLTTCTLRSWRLWDVVALPVVGCGGQCCAQTLVSGKALEGWAPRPWRSSLCLSTPGSRGQSLVQRGTSRWCTVTGNRPAPARLAHGRGDHAEEVKGRLVCSFRCLLAREGRSLLRFPANQAGCHVQARVFATGSEFGFMSWRPLRVVLALQSQSET